MLLRNYFCDEETKFRVELSKSRFESIFKLPGKLLKSLRRQSRL